MDTTAAPAAAEATPTTIATDAPPITTTPTTEATPAAPEKKPDAAEPSVDELLSKVQLSELSSEQLADIESGDPARIRAALGITAAPATEQAKTTEAQTTPTDDDKELKRISLKAIKNPASRANIAQAIQLVRDGKHDDIEDALAEVFQWPRASTTKEAQTEAPPAQEATVNADVQAIEAKITEAEAERARLKSAEGGYDYDAAEQKLAEIMDLKMDLRDAKREAAIKAESAKANQGIQAEWIAKESASREAALSKYGEMMTDPDSSFADYVEVELALAERKNDNILSQPDWPEKIADRVHDKYFKGSQAAQSAQEPSSPIPPAPPPGIRLPGSPVGNGANSTALTAPVASLQLEKLTEEQRFAALQLAEERLAKRR